MVEKKVLSKADWLVRMMAAAKVSLLVVVKAALKEPWLAAVLALALVDEKVAWKAV